MKYLLLLISFTAFGNCDLYKGSEIRSSLCYYEPLIFVKVELMDELRGKKYKGSWWVQDPREDKIPSRLYMTTILDNGKLRYDDN